MIIYEIKNKINGKIYIGQHSSKELDLYYGSGKLIKYAIDNYGIENFERTILERCSTKDDLNDREKFWIKEKNSIINGYNLTNGGTGGDNSQFINYSDEWIEKQKQNAKNYWDNLSDDDRNDRSQKVVGENNPMFGKQSFWKGKKIPKEIVQKSIDNRRSYIGDQNPNWKGGVSKKKCKCGNDISSNTETCAECVDRSGINNSFFGKHHSEETKKKLSEKRKGKKPPNITPVIIDNIVYESLAEASRQTGIPSPTILWRIKSKNIKYENYKSHPSIKAPLSN
jgi:group I intron endonuclease